MKKILLIVTLAVLTCLVFSVPVAAEYNAENPYNEVWYSDIPYDEKFALFNEYIGTGERTNLNNYLNYSNSVISDVSTGNTTEMNRLLTLYVDVCRGLEDFESLSLNDKYACDCLSVKGNIGITENMQDIISQSISLFNDWFKGADECENDVIPENAVFLPLPDKLQYSADRSYIDSLPAIVQTVEVPVETIVEIPVVQTEYVEVPVETIVEVPVVQTEYVEVEKIVKVPVEVPVEVEVVKEVPVEVVKEVKVPVYRTVEVEKPVIQTEYVEVPVIQTEYVEVEKIVEKTVWGSLVEWWDNVWS